MSKLPLVLLPFILSVSSAFSQVGAYAITKIAPAFVRTPEYSLVGGETKRFGKNEQWLEIEVQFLSKVDFTDELTFKYYVALGGKLLAGEVTHINIPKGRELYSVMYVSPRSIARLLENHAASSASLENIGIQILNKGQLVAERSFKEVGAPEWWQQMQQIPGMVLNKLETPFAPLYWDRYEAIKTVSR